MRASASIAASTGARLKELLEEAEDLEDLRGGSTITQQTAKNLFLWSGRSYLRKALELPLAMWMDLILGKRRIMEIYLNIATWGPGAEFGAEAGARRAFGKSARELDAREAALMAAILPNPRRRSASKPGPAVQRLAGIYQAPGQYAGPRFLPETGAAGPERPPVPLDLPPSARGGVPL